MKLKNIQRLNALACSYAGNFITSTRARVSPTQMLFLTLYASTPQAKSCLMHAASDTLSSSGLTYSTLDLHQTAEIDRSANSVLHLEFCTIPWFYELQTLLSIILCIHHEMQLDETVISFTERSMKLYAVVAGAR